MEIISKKLEYELRKLFKSYTDGSIGFLYYPASEDDSPAKKAFIRAKRLAKLGYAQKIQEGSHPIYGITPFGIQYVNGLIEKLP